MFVVVCSEVVWKLLKRVSGPGLVVGPGLWSGVGFWSCLSCDIIGS
jgi:hypothetical protein